MLPVSLDCQFLIAPSVFCNAYMLSKEAANRAVIKSPKQRLETYCFCSVSYYYYYYYYYYYSPFFLSFFGT
jgi:hypothetical protein